MPGPVPLRAQGSITQQAYLKADTVEARAGFGGAVAISGDTAVVSPGSQTAYLYEPHANAWSFTARLKGPFSGSLAIAGDMIVAGARDNNAAFVFVRQGATWSQQAKLTASNAEEGDGLGSCYLPGISGDTIVAGATFEASNAIGVNGDQTSNSATDSGAVYFFAIPEVLPSLSVASNAAGVRFFWPFSSADWTLEHSETIEAGSRTLVPPPYASNGQDLYHDAPLPAGPGFFRLRKP